ncbi:hypothetical protein [Methylocapsa sp. S129]|uniref:hypothetical protein n=1 Tax=Methylocapsa sp. S129 TaxID=1641869 RepID=UPI00131DCEA0|nr:hypothetical protein [Methylocapsa sp. S129]
MLHRYFAGCFLAAAFLAAPAQAAMKPVVETAATSDIALAGAACSYGYHLDVSGLCVDSMDYSRRCSPGLFAVQFPNGNGYRCVPTDWLRESGWLGDFF